MFNFYRHSISNNCTTTQLGKKQRYPLKSEWGEFHVWALYKGSIFKGQCQRHAYPIVLSVHTWKSEQRLCYIVYTWSISFSFHVLKWAQNKYNFNGKCMFGHHYLWGKVVQFRFEWRKWRDRFTLLILLPWKYNFVPRKMNALCDPTNSQRRRLRAILPLLLLLFNAFSTFCNLSESTNNPSFYFSNHGSVWSGARATFLVRLNVGLSVQTVVRGSFAYF